eukprot:2153016-Amphidinium_carterae.2
MTHGGLLGSGGATLSAHNPPGYLTQVKAAGRLYMAWGNVAYVCTGSQNSWTSSCRILSKQHRHSLS